MLGHRRPPFSLGVLAALAGVVLATLAVYPLKSVAPVVSLGVVYLPAVLLVAAAWGWTLGLGTSIASAAAFNFFHIPPTGRFTIADSRNWVALVAFIVVALSASAISEIARARALEAERGRGEADLAAALARELLGGSDTVTALAATGHRLSSAVGLASATIELGSATADRRRQAIPLTDSGGAQIATLLVPQSLSQDLDERLHQRIVPTLSALIAIALGRDAVQAEVVQTEALRRSDDVKTALLRAVSHDLRTPLTAIVAAGHALGSPNLTEEDRRDLADAVTVEGQRMAALVEKLLDLSRLQTGQAPPRTDWVAIEEVIVAARDGLSPAAAASVRVNVDAGLPEVRGDAAQLERVFANLLENATRFSPTVTVNARLSGDHVLVSVVDRGPGIAAKELDRIFEPFYRANTDAVGSGLGLAIARGFAEAGGGSIYVDSHPGQGASFTVSLPIDADV